VAPAPGWDARYDWVGWIPYADMPADDGKKGWIATANQRITPPNYPHYLGQDWNTPHRFERIEQVLSAEPTHSFKDMQVLQNDTLSLSTLTLLPVLKATASAHPLAAQAQKVLLNFDGRMDAQRAAPLIFAVWVDELTRGLIESKLGGDVFKAQYGKRHFRSLVENVMQHKQHPWCAPQSCAEQSTAALARALDRMAAMQGQIPANWRWGEAHLALSTHRPFGQVPWLREVFAVRVPSDGDLFTVNVGQYWAGETYLPFANRHAASLRVVYDLSDLERSQFIYQTGQSGLVWSGNYSDMKNEWAAGKYRPLRRQPDTWAHALVLTP
jgi:penicillin amidase